MRMDYMNDFVRMSNDALDRVDKKKMSDAVDLLFDAWKQKKQVFLMGNGGSASNATHFAADLTKTIMVCEERGLRAFPLSDNIPLVSAIVNDLGWGELYTAQLKTLCLPGDIGIAFSVHGGSGSEKAGAWSQNLLKGVQFVKDRGGKTIGFSGFDGGPLAKLADIGIIIPADSTPVVEGLHAVVFHAITFGLTDRIAVEIGASKTSLRK